RQRFGTRADAAHEDFAEFVPAGKAELLRQTDHRGGLDLRAFGDLAHREDGDLVGIVEKERGACLELRAQVGKTIADGRGELVEGGHVRDALRKRMRYLSMRAMGNEESKAADLQEQRLFLEASRECHRSNAK